MKIKIPATTHIKDEKLSTNKEAPDGRITGKLVVKEIPPMTEVDLPEDEAKSLLAAFAHLGAVEVGKEPVETDPSA